MEISKPLSSMRVAIERLCALVILVTLSPAATYKKMSALPSLQPNRSAPSGSLVNAAPISSASLRAQGLWQRSTIPPQAPRPAQRKVSQVSHAQLEKVHINEGGAPPVRRLNGAGTYVYQGAEIPFDGSTSLSSKAFLPSDVWAIGYVLLRILSP